MINPIPQESPSTSIFKFRGIPLTFYEIDNKPWITAKQLSKALGCFSRHRAEKLYYQFKFFFDASMTKKVKATMIRLEGNDVLLFSEQGAINIAMMAHTDMSNFFLHWITQTLRIFKDKPTYEFQPFNPKYQVSASMFKAIHEVLETVKIRLDAVAAIDTNHKQSTWLRDKLIDEAKLEVSVITHGLYAKQYPAIYVSPFNHEANSKAEQFQKIERNNIKINT
ncbi:MAG: hypothetical protein IPP74_07935 [Alphaproteobacteria bacterium]|nr:hypothetical protein [Alphaproteobacteria bacterium]